jgi:hypothetical protein
MRAILNLLGTFVGNLFKSRRRLRLLLLAGIVLLIGDYSFAQDSPDPTPMQCQLIKQAVAQYGFAAARRHALETYGPEAVKTGDKCFTNVGLRLRARTKRHGE